MTQVLLDLNLIDQLPKALTSSVVTIGNFDGVHRGHQSLIAETVLQAQAANVPSIALTFSPHPLEVLRPELGEQPLLSDSQKKIQLLSQLELDIVIEHPFTKEFSQFSSEYFFKEILVKKLKPVAIVIGYDFNFGKARTGGHAQLSAWCNEAGIRLTIVPALLHEQTPISSSRIRQFCQKGDLESANILLGHPLTYSEVVIHGDKRGRLLGFPTANMKHSLRLPLPLGIYASTVKILQKEESLHQLFFAATSIGMRPTVYENATPIIESYLLDTSIDLYGKTLEISFIKRLRGELKFSDLEKLKEQISIDVAQCRTTLASTH